MRHLLLAAALVFAAAAASATEYEIDPQHSSISFKAKHVAGKVPGRFKKFSGTFTYDPKSVKSWKAEAKIDAASIDTDVEQRDKHLKSDAFFDAEKCPDIVFKSTKVEDVKGDHFKLAGDLTMHCVTKPVILDVESNGSGKDPWGNESASFSATATVNRKDWGISWNKTLDNGSLFVGDKIDLILEITGNVKKAEAPAKP
ncbi:MAG TPA: YceI family protein [Elusimicrobiota bacterium]|nr:YceI family protein [Elusimicrobiota bacterium]